MFGWLKKKVRFTGMALFRGSMIPRADEFGYLQKSGITAAPVKPKPGMAWALRLEHPTWGHAAMFPVPGMWPPAKTMIDWAPSLDDDEKAAMGAAGFHLAVKTEATANHILRDRKHALRFLRAVLGDDGLGAIDLVAQLPWSVRELDDELMHDADLDISQTHVLHFVTRGEPDEEKAEPVWLHSHGLAEIGRFDFDIVAPHEDVYQKGQDGLRAIAFAIAEGAVNETTSSFMVGYPRGNVRFVPAKEFTRLAAAQYASLRAEAGGEHDEKRAVLCEPVGGLFGRWSKRVKPSRFFSRPMPDNVVFHFSGDATDLMAERARNTYPVFQSLVDEFADLDLPVMVKLGYPVDDGEPNEREHLWFTVHACGDREIEATLENEPLSVSRLKEGDRGTHPLDLLTDWIIMTPIGNITPRHIGMARRIRQHRDALGKALAEMRRLAEAGDEA